MFVINLVSWWAVSDISATYLLLFFLPVELNAKFSYS